MLSKSSSKAVRRHLAAKTEALLCKSLGLKSLSEVLAAKSTRIEHQIALAFNCL
jgi:hypothetical protein